MASLTLAELLRTLTMPNGAPDIPRRKKQILQLMEDLLPSEVRLVKNSVRTKTFMRDFVPDLPAEIIVLISSYLAIDDLASVRYVSQEWRETWSSIAVCNKLMKKHFRDSFEKEYSLLANDLRPARLVAGIDRLYAMQRGEYAAMRIIRYDGDVEPESGPTPVFDRQYCNGKVAWPIKGGIQVTTLVNSQVSTYMTPQRYDVLPGSWKLADGFLVVGTGASHGSPFLYAWDLDSDQMYTTPLPCPPGESIDVRGENIGVVTSSKECFFWNIRGKLKQMKLQDLNTGPKRFRKMAVLFHPTMEDTIFVICLNCKSPENESDLSGIVSWTIQKYVQFRYIEAYEHSYPLEGLDHRAADSPEDAFPFIIKKADENGNWSLGPVPLNFADGLLDLGCDHHWDRWYRRVGSRYLAHFILFNVYSGRLTTKYFHLPGGGKQIEEDALFATPQDESRVIWKSSHIWNNQLLLPVVNVVDPKPFFKAPPYHLKIKSALMIALKSCDQIGGLPAKIRYIAGYDTKEISKTDGQFYTRDMGLAYCWAGDPHLSKLPVDPSNHETDNLREVRGDEKFVVLFGRYDYVIWSFD